MTFDDLKYLKTLLIDDDEFVRDSIRLMFESRNCCIDAVESAEEALDLLRAQRYDIVITDYRLPGIDGLELCRRLQSIRPRPLTILITAYGSPTLIGNACDVGVGELIEKPITFDAIESSLARLLNDP